MYSVQVFNLRVKQCPIQVFRKCHHHLRRADWTRCVVGFTSWTSWSLCWGSGDGGSGHAALPIQSSVAHTLLSRGLFLISPRFYTLLAHWQIHAACRPVQRLTPGTAHDCDLYMWFNHLVLIQPTTNAKWSLNRRDNHSSNDTRRYW